MMERLQNRSAARLSVAIVTFGVVLGACNKPRAMGEPTEIVAAASPATWEVVADEVTDAVEPRTFTVRDERVFDVIYVDPTGADWPRRQLNRQVLLLGTTEDPTVAEAIAAYDGVVPDPPAIFQVENLWALGQVVTVALIPTGSSPDAVTALLPPLGHSYLQQFEQYAAARMFVSGANEALRDSLRSQAGFGLLVPGVYDATEPEPDVYVFRNDQPDPATLIRNVTVASRPNDEVEITAETAASWRAELASRHTTPPQLTEANEGSVQVDVNGKSALQIQGVWSNPPGAWPAAGPFLTRLVECPDRTFLIDAWLYAPGSKKYEYMFQLNTILDSFECG